jgi:predicted nucleic acid-binding protein
MILVDTSVWVDHLSQGRPQLAELLDEAQVVCHPFVIGELARGNLRRRREILGLLAELPQARVAEHDELLYLIEQHRLFGQRLRCVDAHLLGSALLSSCHLWTADTALHPAARQLRVAADIEGAR